jgi:hypothetical protein
MSSDTCAEKYYLRLFSENDIEDLYETLKEPAVVRHMLTEGFSKDTCIWIIKDSIEHWEKYNIGSYAVVFEKGNKVVG